MDNNITYPLYQLLLDTNEDTESSILTKEAHVERGEPIQMQCQVEGETHNESEFAFMFRGVNIKENTIKFRESVTISDLPTGIGQTISINKFEETHEGLYECRVRRKDERSQSKTLKLIRRPPVVWRLPPGFDLCSGENRDGYCLNDGVCMQHIDSGKPTCRCMSGWTGSNCAVVGEYCSILYKPQIEELEQYKTATITLSISAAFFFIIASFCAYLLIRQRKKTKSYAGSQQHKSLDCNGVESPLLDNKNKKEYCWNCGLSQALINGAYETNPIDKRISTTIDEHRHEMTINNHHTTIQRVASCPTTMDVALFDQYDRNCPDCLAELRSYFYPDSTIQSPPFNYASIKSVDHRNRLMGISDDNQRFDIKASSSPTTPKLLRRMISCGEGHRQHCNK